MTSPSKVCDAEGCGRPVVARGLCATHYKRMQRLREKDGGRVHLLGDLLDLYAVPIRVVDPDRGCSVKGCDHIHHANGLCDKHNKRRWRSL
jgi:hypothetical protein